MTRTTLLLLFGLSMLVSFSLQAGDRQWHQHNLKDGHHYKHEGGHYKLRGNRHRGCKHTSHKRYRGQVQFFTIPQIASGTTYGYSVSGQVIVYPSYSLNGRR